jgi:phosphoglycolate phosphatase-like HAD superfamily hydrolase
LEILRPNPHPGRLRHAVFDFDGTLSLLRAGWQQVMADLMLETLLGAPRAESEAALRARIDEPVNGWAGRPTLEQMQWLAAAVRERGGQPLPAEAYKQQYLDRLRERVTHRADVEAGRVPPERYRVAGALDFVAALHARGVACHVASGTDEAAVQAEAALLGYAPLIQQLRGARPDGGDAKGELIGALAAEHKLRPGELAAFGDGQAEMRCARAVRGLACGLATDEAGGGAVDARKRALLINAGADVILPDFQQRADVFRYLWPGE